MKWLKTAKPAARRTMLILRPGTRQYKRLAAAGWLAAVIDGCWLATDARAKKYARPLRLQLPKGQKVEKMHADSRHHQLGCFMNYKFVPLKFLCTDILYLNPAGPNPKSVGAGQWISRNKHPGHESTQRSQDRVSYK
jgi:hypothetical protein